MAVLAAAALLDELMGRNRNALGDKPKDLNWEDPEVSLLVLLTIVSLHQAITDIFTQSGFGRSGVCCVISLR